ncbi:MAG: SsrA-binding protein [Candidatus Lambdaproteobacteria bacterium RIFOXYD1_FULL_56_27]|uniref:SsrA-binding protein n=1 Tax=Candidatus Lambdaproteobacteria bacterium RIFOXYD2_FULL_56_26 TaxID=1817773 RepID=A0A1F6GQP9_9PROT|nr:MAG: SsrA-binding protein [Candidatus Lambdaproteobacteria bacterium RIFOXYD2_FULL_56_26]OGH04113.1 MAG: SsrA-binding protein [Candidatus Lambdaproteobacteria bacterium RIFOXYC1_FULL_56_13]OGH06370.1 MAG: SsrA-binding protein [Candidatus Lambdaproteobacteria bacterium RIFOXYD1_FULL_56_27]
MSSIIQNKKAFFEYEVLDRFEAGIALVGTEVKSLRAGKVKIIEAFCRVTNDGQLELHQLDISPYEFGNQNNHDRSRVRKLLMKHSEIRKLGQMIKEKGLTLIPISMYFKRGKVKVEIALAKGKKLHDKRASLKEKDTQREIDRAIKGGG